MTYRELISYLLEKYGAAKYDYFCNESCRSKNHKVSRTSEGLFCHHIDEDRAIMLSNTLLAKMHPWEYQKADRLVYCNVLEHLILHIKIVEGPLSEDNSKIGIYGIGGAITCLCPEINDFYNGYKFQKQYLIKIYSLIEDNFDDYIYILKYFLNVLDKNPTYKAFVTKKKLSVDHEGKIVKKIYNQL